ncbi:MAG: hypothetical protein ABIR71_10150 [Chthoniobacterales bacterium]
MKSTRRTLTATMLACLPLAFAQAQSPSPSPASGSKPAAAAPSAQTDVYHVHFSKAAAGKAAQQEKELKKPDPEAPMPGHVLLLRHQDGAAWDFVGIEHLGAKATVDPARPPVPPEVRNLGDWHNDTYTSGPSWAEFAKEMGMDESGKSKAANAVYVVSTYRAVSGQRDALQKFLGEAPDPANDKAAGNVTLQHLEGAEWNFVVITRYDSWADFATSESNSVAETAKGTGGWFKLRELAQHHEDTIAVRVSP